MESLLIAGLIGRITEIFLVFVDGFRDADTSFDGLFESIDQIGEYPLISLDPSEALVQISKDGGVWISAVGLPEGPIARRSIAQSRHTPLYRAMILRTWLEFMTPPPLKSDHVQPL